MEQPIEVRSIEDARKVDKETLVGIVFSVEAGGGEKNNLVNYGVMDNISFNQVRIVTSVVGRGHSPLARVNYQWSEQNKIFCLDTAVPVYVEENSPEFKDYAKALLIGLGGVA